MFGWKRVVSHVHVSGHLCKMISIFSLNLHVPGRKKVSELRVIIFSCQLFVCSRTQNLYLKTEDKLVFVKKTTGWWFGCWSGRWVGWLLGWVGRWGFGPGVGYLCREIFVFGLFVFSFHLSVFRFVQDLPLK